ncbi:MAG: hypothetical protein E7K72_11900 [Roseomonas mucosa]|nr:hypothetical protein [Roseomonas mucosa]
MEITTATLPATSVAMRSYGRALEDWLDSRPGPAPHEIREELRSHAEMWGFAADEMAVLEARCAMQQAELDRLHRQSAGLYGRLATWWRRALHAGHAGEAR